MLADFILNVVLFIPLGIFLYAGLLVNRSRARAILVTTVFAAFVSSAIEFCQFYFPRDPALFDIVANGLGASIGALVSGSLPFSLFDLLGALWNRLQPTGILALFGLFLASIPLLLSLIQFLRPFAVRIPVLLFKSVMKLRGTGRGSVRFTL